MRQQINLYQPIFSEGRKPLSAVTLAGVLLALIVGLGAYAIKTQIDVQQLNAQVETLRAQQAEQENLAGEGSTAEPIETVEARVKKLDRLVLERSQGLEVLKSGAAGTTIGFAPRLEALARRHVDGLWVDSMQLSGANGAMTLAGGSYNPDIIPIYLRSLSQDQVLAGTRFDDFVIERPIAADAPTQEGDSPRAPKPIDPKLVRFRAGSSTLAPTDVEATS